MAVCSSRRKRGWLGGRRTSMPERRGRAGADDGVNAGRKRSLQGELLFTSLFDLQL
ncbi:hypothetical protein BC829DRAFT_396207, partial [Chytridium lagenaria]